MVEPRGVDTTRPHSSSGLRRSNPGLGTQIRFRGQFLRGFSVLPATIPPRIVVPNLTTVTYIVFFVFSDHMITFVEEEGRISRKRLSCILKM